MARAPSRPPGGRLHCGRRLTPHSEARAYNPRVRLLPYVRAFALALAALISFQIALRLQAQGALVLAPPPALDGPLVFNIERAGNLPSPVNPTSPLVAGDTLLLIDQAGRLLRWDGAATTEIFRSDQAPQGLKLMGPESVLNAAATSDGHRLFVMFTSSVVPRGVPERRSPRAADAWHVLYEFAFDGKALTNPRPIVALQVRSDGHTGGGMTVLADGSVLFATADNGDAGEDGRAYPQDAGNHLGKILRIDPSNGTTRVVALGVRNPQRLDLGVREGEMYVDFADMGGSVSEELNSIRLTDLLQAGRINNFGWGRNADGRAREGSFYIDAGGKATGRVPESGEPGFLAPVAEVGRGARAGFGLSGVASPPSPSGVSMLAADLVSGDLFGLAGPRGARRQALTNVELRSSSVLSAVAQAKANDASGRTSLGQLAKNERPDPRFFSFPDGAAGVLLEKTGDFFRLTPRVQAQPAAPGALPRDGFFSSNGVRLHYVEQGRGDAVFLLHDLDGSVSTFLRSGIFQDLARTHRAIALDSRGHGLSDKPREASAYGSEMAADVVRLMDELKIARAHVVGYSMGTEVAAMLVVRAPERVRSVVLIAGAGRFRWLPTDDQHMEEEALEFENFGVSPKLFLEQTPAGTPDPTMEELARRSAVALADPLRDVKALAAFSRARRARVVDQARLAAAASPMLGIAGSLDPELDALRTLKALRPGLEIVTVAGAAHAGDGRVIDRSECLAAIRAFLARAANPLGVDKPDRTYGH